MLYAVGIVELQLESTSGLILLLFVVPLAFTLSGFLLWIMFALNTTMAHLKQRKQRYKLGMFTKLYRILLGAVAIIAAFFVVSTMSFSARFAEGEISHSFVDVLPPLTRLHRLRCQYVEGTLVAVGWLARSAILRCVWVYRLSLAPICE